MMYHCWKCGHSNKKGDLRPSCKIHKCTLEFSRKAKMCAKCKCRVFLTNEEHKQ